VSTLLGLLQRSTDDLVALFWVVVFVLGPLVLRALKALGQKRAETPGPRGSGSEALERRRRAREAQREGEDLWRRLARGESAAPPPRPPVVVAEPRRREPLSLETEEAPVPIGTLGTVTEPGEVATPSLETEAEPIALGVLAASPSAEPAPRARARRPRADWRRAVVLAEVLAAPVSERREALPGMRA